MACLPANVGDGEETVRSVVEYQKPLPVSSVSVELRA